MSEIKGGKLSPLLRGYKLQKKYEPMLNLKVRLKKLFFISEDL